MKHRILLPLTAVVLSAFPAVAQTAAPGKKAAPQAEKVDKASAYYHFSLGHLYTELAGAYGNKGEYLNKAIENYRLAMREDPDASFLAEELSDLYVQSGRLREAVTEAEEALKANPKDLNSRRILGRIYTRMIGDSQQGKVDETMLKKAIEQYDIIAKAEPKDIEALLLLGRLQKVAQNSVESEKAYKLVLENDPNNEDALTGLAIVYADLGNTKESTDLLRRVAEKSPSLRTLTALASQYEQMRDYPMAAETLRRTLEVAPDNIDVRRAYAQNLMLADQLDEALKQFTAIAASDKKDWQSWLRVSQIYRQKRDFTKAAEAGQKAVEIESNNLEVRYNNVALLEAQGKQAEALAAMNVLLTGTTKRTYSAGERTNRIVLLERLAGMYRMADQWDKAVESYRQIGELEPNAAPRVAAQIADTWRLAKQYTKALDEASAAAKKFPDDRAVRSVRASILADTGKTDEAAAEAKKLFDGKSDRETWITLAQIYEKGKNFTEMRKAIDEADKLSTDKDDKESVAFMRGAMFEKMKDFDNAEKEFRKVLDMNPKNTSALNYLGYMLADRNVRLPEALTLIRQAVDIDPENGAYLDSLGWVYYRMNDLDQAERNLQRAIERFSKDPTVHDHLGDVYFKKGKLKDAIAQWQKSLTEWQNASASEADSTEMAKVQKKLEGARVRLARESGSGAGQQRQQ
ncbi:MAG: tetratricopeptide repeat protein [Bryobacteraceae bacterium]|nr:tetratricopeptide repeat protein [Bryobacteraceae bacterium]